ncbi:MAG: hypothetical protein ACE5H4_15725 [Candidatus Thorarchaeota archaeon]
MPTEAGYPYKMLTSAKQACPKTEQALLLISRDSFGSPNGFDWYGHQDSYYTPAKPALVIAVYREESSVSSTEQDPRRSSSKKR